jgi:hypothetical protein
MSRRGRCRCGFVLKFKKGPDGYKTRCPSCGSGVRLKPVTAAARKRKRSKGIDRSRAPVSELPAIPVPASEPGPREGRTVTCEVCYALVPTQASHCPDCGSVLDRTVAASALDAEHSFMSKAAPKSFSKKLMLVWLTAGAVLLIAAIVLILSMRH